MKDLYLKDILNLSEEDIQNARIALNMKVNNQSAFQVWEESKPDNRGSNFRIGLIIVLKKEISYKGKYVLVLFNYQMIIKNGYLLLLAK